MRTLTILTLVAFGLSFLASCQVSTGPGVDKSSFYNRPHSKGSDN